MCEEKGLLLGTTVVGGEAGNSPPGGLTVYDGITNTGGMYSDTLDVIG